jgi:dTDP-4-dehydrorhamnose 3,5-epimerase
MRIIEEILPGCFVLEPEIKFDERGFFVKTFNAEIFKNFGIHFEVKEEFFSESKSRVIRGMHFQLPPHAHKKLVYCLTGSAIDVLLDLRRGQNYGAVKSVEISSDNKRIVYIPEGVAHGFKALSESTTMVYKTSVIYTQSADVGIKWDSFGFNWGNDEPLISERDKSHILFSQFESPFGYR